jgi:PhoH-like ATPase
MGNDKTTLDMYIEEGKIEVEAMTYIRGRSISNSYIVIDEVQNMTQHEIKTVLTRVGENTKIILTGDIEQIDNVYIDETNNALSYVVEKLKSHDISGHITLVKGERSKVATIASEVL